MTRHSAPGANWSVVAAFLCAIGAAGCSTIEDFTDFLSGSSSMRIDVEVYKGPLANDPTVQWAEVMAALREADTSLCFVQRTTAASAEKLPVSSGQSSDASINGARSIDSDAAQASKQRGETARSGNQATACTISDKDQRGASSSISLAGIANSFSELFTDNIESSIGRLYGDVEDSRAALKSAHDACQLKRDKLPVIDEAKITTRSDGASKRPLIVVLGSESGDGFNTVKYCLQEINQAAARLRIKSTYWASQLAVTLPARRADRNSIALFADVAAQYGNQLGARADSLTKQLHGRNRYDLPLSVLLRDTYPSDTQNLFVWYHAAANPLAQDTLRDPIGAVGSEERRSRIRGLERLFGDINWSKINTVYASGQGETTLALIKDDIGNWNLKSFDQDPTQLLKAYTDLAATALDAAKTMIVPGSAAPARLIETFDNRLSAAKQLNDFAGSVNGSTAPSRAAQIDPRFIDGLRAAYLARLDKVISANPPATQPPSTQSPGQQTTEPMPGAPPSAGAPAPATESTAEQQSAAGAAQPEQAAPKPGESRPAPDQSRPASLPRQSPTQAAVDALLAEYEDVIAKMEIGAVTRPKGMPTN